MSVRLRPVLLIGLLVLQAFTVFAVVVSTGRNTEGLLVDAMGRTMMLAVETLDQRTSEHLSPAEDAAQLSADLLSSGVLAAEDDRLLLEYLDSQVLSNDSITGAYIGRPDGSFLLVSRDGATIEGGTRVKTITVGADGRRSVTVQRDADGVEQDEAEDPSDTYDPRARPWYEAALGADELIWTEPYIFFASREPGITTATAARDEDGQVVAVVGVDLSLRDLSTFVGSVEVGGDSRAVLVDTAGLMVAAGDVDQVNVDDGDGGLRRASIDEVTDPVIAAGLLVGSELVDVTVETGPVVLPFEVEGRAWQVAVAPLAARGSWLAAVAAPEDQFVSNVVSTNRENVLMAVLIGLAVTAVAAPAVMAISRRVDRIASDAVTDSVTGIANRRQFDAVLVDQLGRATPDHPVCVAIIDLDRFKEINDTWGHNAGDQVLAVVAARLRGELRDRDLVARIGGDEFAVVLVDTRTDGAWDVLERARRSVVDAPVHTDKGEIEVTITIGVTEANGLPGDDRSTVMERADRALYDAKEAGGDRMSGTVS